jgi:hypothetical protein
MKRWQSCAHISFCHILRCVLQGASEQVKRVQSILPVQVQDLQTVNYYFARKCKATGSSSKSMQHYKAKTLG